MAIKSNKKIDFEYEYQSVNGESYSISLRFYHSEEYGPTIAFLDDEGEPAMNLPVGIFPEVNEYLVEQGIVEGQVKRQLSLPQMPVKSQRPTIQKPSLPKPRLVSTNRTAAVPNKPIQIDVTDDEEQQIIAEQEHQQRIDDINASIEGQMPAHSLSGNAEQHVLSEDEIAAIMAERSGAAAKKVSKPLRRKE